MPTHAAQSACKSTCHVKYINQTNYRRCICHIHTFLSTNLLALFILSYRHTLWCGDSCALHILAYGRYFYAGNFVHLLRFFCPLYCYVRHLLPFISGTPNDFWSLHQPILPVIFLAVLCFVVYHNSCPLCVLRFSVKWYCLYIGLQFALANDFCISWIF